MIVAEVSKWWLIEGYREPISHEFEKVIKVNMLRGYRLHSWKLCQTGDPQQALVETIVAVFERTT